MTCKDEATIAGVIEVLKVKYHDMQEHTGVKHMYLWMSLDLSVIWVCFITVPMAIADVLKDIEQESVVTPVFGTLFTITESSLLGFESRSAISR